MGGHGSWAAIVAPGRGTSIATAGVMTYVLGRLVNGPIRGHRPRSWAPSLPPLEMTMAGRQPSPGSPLWASLPIAADRLYWPLYGVAVGPPMRLVSPTPSRRSRSFNAEAMVPPGLDPVTPRGCGSARRGQEGRGQELAYTPGDDLPLRRPHTHSEVKRWTTTEELDRDGKTSPLR